MAASTTLNESSKILSMHDAYDDLLRRTLAAIPCDLARLIYLASTRDYNSGTYHHEGLSQRYRPDEARNALEAAHRDIFYRLAELPLEELVAELEAYVRASRETPLEFLRTWQELEPYRVAVPMEVGTTMVQLFLSNIRIALEVLRWRLQQHPEIPSDALPRQLPGR
jgi:hypothetical protein